MQVRAKFKVQSVLRTLNWHGSGEMQTIKMEPATTGSKENEAFYEATPSGHIELGIVSKEVGDQFQIGKYYYVDFTSAT